MSQPTQAYDQARKVFRYFRRKKDKLIVVSEKDLVKFPIQRTHIDWNPGTPNDRSPKLVDSVPADKLGIQPPDLEECIQNIYDLGQHTNFHVGRLLGQNLLNLLEGSTKVDSEQIAKKESPWVIKFFPGIDFDLFHAIFLLYSSIDIFPDVKCFNAVDHDLKNDTIYWSELYTICAWLFVRLDDLKSCPRDFSFRGNSVGFRNSIIYMVGRPLWRFNSRISSRLRGVRRRFVPQ
ncbi:hypothetical protein F5B19DRAFT_480428 [Rostrohypoxylon terebratum]|nr:hypothetical protein F5B19DRAFT_480428 [Rostrohypoxylon terebratum]